MRVYAIGNTPTVGCDASVLVCEKHLNNVAGLQTDNFIRKSPKVTQIGFEGFKFHLVDGGSHADTMKHFAKAIMGDVEDNVTFAFHEIKNLVSNDGLKDLKSLDEKLKYLDKDGVALPHDYVAIPCTASIHLKNLSERVERVLGVEETFTPANIKSKKKIVLEFLDKLPNSGSVQRSYTDPAAQGFIYLPSIIKSINNLVKKGVNVFIPAEHPIENILKWKAGQEGLKNQLYQYIATGKDEGNRVNKLITELKKNNEYFFNLLTLSDARIVSLQNKAETADYIYGAFDSCVTDKARGVYNFYPVRDKKDRVLGYSFTDKQTIQYPYDEFLANSKIDPLLQYVGRIINSVMFTSTEYRQRAYLVRCGEKVQPEPPHFLRELSRVFSLDTIKSSEIWRLGDIASPDGKYIFSVNRHREVIFPKTDCEGSGRPSVLPMWGNCFATVNSVIKNLKKDIDGFSTQIVPNMLYQAEKHINSENYGDAESVYLNALRLAKPEKEVPFPSVEEYLISEKLINLYIMQGKLDEAEKLTKSMLEKSCRQIFKLMAKTKDNHTFLRIKSCWDEKDCRPMVVPFQFGVKYYGQLSEIYAKQDNKKLAELCKWGGEQMMRLTEGGERAASLAAYRCNDLEELEDVRKHSYR